MKNKKNVVAVAEQKCVACVLNEEKIFSTRRLMQKVFETVELVSSSELRNEFAEELAIKLAEAKATHNHF